MCYTVPTAAAIITTFMYKRSKSLKLWWLNLLFYGGALFGITDHLWNGELLLISENLAKDFALGFVITGAITLVWVLVLKAAKTSPSLANNLRVVEN